MSTREIDERIAAALERLAWTEEPHERIGVSLLRVAAELRAAKACNECCSADGIHDAKCPTLRTAEPESEPACSHRWDVGPYNSRCDKCGLVVKCECPDDASPNSWRCPLHDAPAPPPSLVEQSIAIANDWSLDSGVVRNQLEKCADALEAAQAETNVLRAQLNSLHNEVARAGAHSNGSDYSCALSAILDMKQGLHEAQADTRRLARVEEAAMRAFQAWHTNALDSEFEREMIALAATMERGK